MRTPLLLALALLAGCSPSPVDIEPVPSEAVATTTAPLAEAEEAPQVASAPASVVHGTWVAEGATVIVSEEGLGSVTAGVAEFQPFSVVRNSADELVLAAEDGTEYRFALGDTPSLMLSSRPDLTLTRR